MTLVSCQPGPCIGTFAVMFFMCLIGAAMVAWIPVLGWILAIVLFIGGMSHACSKGSPLLKYCGCSAACDEYSQVYEPNQPEPGMLAASGNR